MTTFFQWFKNSRIQAVLLIAFTFLDFILLGRSFELSKSDWASWVQAIGSIGAIVGAFAIAQSQHARERTKAVDAELIARTLAIRNMVQIASFSLEAAEHLVRDKQNAFNEWMADQHATRIDRLCAILDSLITPQTNHIAVLAALHISTTLIQVQHHMRHTGGAMSGTLFSECEDRITDAHRYLQELIMLQHNLEAMCTDRRVPMCDEDLRT
ncbi:MAG: hypothetical protein K2X55_01125 [Burkholderiaceae bacterium]|nr:hypothetical protein [Burkholderiaceae bacterium]